MTVRVTVDDREARLREACQVIVGLILMYGGAVSTAYRVAAEFARGIEHSDSSTTTA